MISAMKMRKEKGLWNVWEGENQNRCIGKASRKERDFWLQTWRNWGSQPHWSLGDSRWQEQQSEVPWRSTAGLLGQGGEWSWGTETRTTNPENATERLWAGGGNAAWFLLNRLSCCVVKIRQQARKTFWNSGESWIPVWGICFWFVEWRGCIKLIFF